VGKAALLCVFALPAALCVAWTLLAGKDVNWDLLNYHYYGPFQLLAGRLQQDFFAASAQGYLNPLGYLPLYLMVSSGWHSVAASIALAALHSASIALLYLIAWRLFAHLEERSRRLFAALAAALGTATSVYWATVGSSFLDPLLAPLMLAGLLALLDGGPHATRNALLAGVLFGSAAALKYSNAIFVLAAAPLALAMPGTSGAKRWHAGLGYAAGATLALGVLAGPWLILMAREFGNPVFPLMNAWFGSPHAPPINMISERFGPTDLVGALAFPLRMMALDSTVYLENFAPDLRFAALAVGAIALAALAPWRSALPEIRLRGADWRVLGFVAAGFVLWLVTSANGRYGMVVLLLGGVCLARIVERLLPLAAARVALGVLLAVQVGATVLASPARWYVAEPWSRHWLPYAVPERARSEPALYLTLEELPMAVLAPLVHPDSSFVNLRGQYSIPGDSPKLAALLERHRGRARVLGRGLELVDGTLPEGRAKPYDDTLSRIGLRVDTEDCFAIPWQPRDDDLVSRAANRIAGRRQPHSALLSAASCALRPAKRDPAVMEAEKRVSALFDRMEKTCPTLFRGQVALTEPLGRGWSRLYPGLDVRLEAHADRVVLNRYRAGTHVDLGRLSDWERGEVPPQCR
jgi:hypothetical protein